MANGRVKVSAVGGSMSFDLTQLADIWSNLRDRNYYTAFRKIVRIIDSVVNPEVGRVNLLSFKEDIEGVRVDDYCTKLEQWCEECKSARLSSATVGEFVGSTDEQAKIDPATIIMLVQLLVNLIASWRKRKDEPQTVGAVDPRKLPVTPKEPEKNPEVPKEPETPKVPEEDEPDDGEGVPEKDDDTDDGTKPKPTPHQSPATKRGGKK